MSLSHHHRTLGARQIPFCGRDEIFSIDIKQSQIKDTLMSVNKDSLEEKWPPA